MKPAPLEYLVARTTDEALALLERFEGDARLLVGGQSLVPLLSMRLLRPKAVVDIGGIPGLDGVAVDGGALTIGALARYSALEASATVRERLPLLARAVPFVGDRQVRNRGTLGGALSHADPAGEMALCAVTLGARLRAAGPAGTREIEAGDFFRGPYTTALEATEMLVEAVFPDGAGTLAWSLSTRGVTATSRWSAWPPPPSQARATRGDGCGSAWVPWPIAPCSRAAPRA